MNMIPDFTQSGVLPPFKPGSTPAHKNAVSPYKTSLEDIVLKYATSPERITILNGFIQYRIYLKSIGFKSGFQWIDGSFSENIEKTQNRPPNDIDVVTFAPRPVNYKEDKKWKDFISMNQDFIMSQTMKSKFHCDAYHVDLDVSQEFIVRITAYWFGLFSHKRDTLLWKGMLELSLDEDEKNALELLNEVSK